MLVVCVGVGCGGGCWVVCVGVGCFAGCWLFRWLLVVCVGCCLFVLGVGGWGGLMIVVGGWLFVFWFWVVLVFMF